MEMKFFPPTKSKQFNLERHLNAPRNESKQESVERINRERIEEEGEKTVPSYGSGIKGQFRNSRRGENNKTFAEIRKKSNLRLLYILIILSALIYFFLK